jgi:hypothetical protein
MAETIRGLNIKLGLDGSELENKLKNVKGELKEQKKDLSVINKSLRFDSSNIDLWKKKQSTLNDTINTTKSRLDLQNKKLDEAKKALALGDISEKEFKYLERGVMYSTAEVDKLNSELVRTKERITSLGNAKFDKIAKVGGTLTKSLTAPILGATAALTGFAIASGTVADEFNDQALKLGLSMEQLQEWSYIAKLNAIESTSLEKAFIKLNGALGDIASGDTDKLSESLGRIGLSIEDIKSQDADGAFETIREAMSGVTDETTRVAVANDLFGEKIASEMMPILLLEQTEVNNLKEELHGLGMLTQEQADISGEFNDELDKTKMGITAVGANIAEVLLPILTNLMTSFQDNVIPVLNSVVEKWKSLTTGQQKFILTMIGIVASIGPVLLAVGKVTPIVKTLGSSFKMLGQSGIFAGTGINFATLGIGALIAIIAMALMQSEEFKEILMQLGETIMELVTPIMNIVEILMEALAPIFLFVADTVKILLDLLMPLLEVALLPLQASFGLLAKLIEPFVPLLRLVANVISSVMVPAMELLFMIIEPIVSAITEIVNSVASAGNWILDLLGLNSGAQTSSSSNTNTTNVSNNVTVNTTAQQFDINSINNALGSEYL